MVNKRKRIKTTENKKEKKKKKATIKVHGRGGNLLGDLRKRYELPLREYYETLTRLIYGARR